MQIHINPGSGKTPTGTRWQSENNIERLIEDCDLQGISYEFICVEENGRHRYRLFLNGNDVAVSMPAIELEKVRYIKAPGQSAWDFYRLFVDDSSWLWEFAVRIVREILNDER